MHIENINFCATTALEYLYKWQIIGGTANTLKDCEKLINNKVDYIILSPFRVSNNEEGESTTLGLNGFSLIVDALKTKTPIIGLGDIASDDVKTILETGVSGVAVSDEITCNFDSIQLFHKLLSASSINEQRHTF